MTKAIELKDSDFDSAVLQADLPVLVDFWSPGCVPCRAMAPIIEALAGELEGKVKVVKINLYDCMGTAAKLNVSSLPTLLVFNKGQMVEKVNTALGRDKIMALLNKYLS